MLSIKSGNPLSLIMGVVLDQKWQTVITNYGCPKQNFFAPYLDIVDTGATITLNKVRKVNQSNFTIE